MSVAGRLTRAPQSQSLAVAAAILLLALVLWLSAFVDPAVGAGTAAAVLVAVTILLAPEAAPLVCAVASLAVWSYTVEAFSVRVLGFTWYPNDWIGACLLLGLALRTAVGIRPVPVRVPLFRPWLVLIAVMSVCAVYSLAIGNSRRDLFADLRPFVYYGGVLLAPFVITTRAQMLRFAHGSVFCGLVGSIDGIVRSLTGPGFSMYGMHLHFARLIGPSEIIYPLTLLFAMGLLVNERRTSMRAWLVVCVVVSGIASFLTYSRGTYLSLGLGIAVMIGLTATTSRKRALDAVIFALVVIAATAGVMQMIGVSLQSSFVERTKSISLTDVDLSIAQRLFEWNTAWNAFRAHPILGAGLGHLFTFYLPTFKWFTYNYCHNSYLYVLSKTGLVGFTAFAIFLASWGLALLRAYRRATDDGVRGMVLGWSAVFAFLLLKSSTTWFLNIHNWALYFSFMIGAVLLLARAPQRFAEE